MNVKEDKDTRIIVNDVDLGEILVDRNLNNAWIEIKKEMLWAKEAGNEGGFILGLETALDIIGNLMVLDKIERIKDGEKGE